MRGDAPARGDRGAPAAATLSVRDLPDGVLANVVTYLAPPSRAMLAVATESRAIISNDSGEWSTLDFVDVEESLAKKLTDDDFHRILVCIDARESLKVLKLTGCVNITGKGLEPLRGSVVLEQIDLSLVQSTRVHTSIQNQKFRKLIRYLSSAAL